MTHLSLINSRVIHKHIAQTFPKHLMFSKEGFSILEHEFFVLAQSIFFGIFTQKILDARQSEILNVLSRKSFLASAESTRFVFKIIKSL